MCGPCPVCSGACHERGQHAAAGEFEVHLAGPVLSPACCVRWPWMESPGRGAPSLAVCPVQRVGHSCPACRDQAGVKGAARVRRSSVSKWPQLILRLRAAALAGG